MKTQTNTKRTTPVYLRKKGETIGCTYRIPAKMYRILRYGDKSLEVAPVGKTHKEVIDYLNISMGLKRPIYKLEVEGLDN